MNYNGIELEEIRERIKDLLFYLDMTLMAMSGLAEEAKKEKSFDKYNKYEEQYLDAQKTVTHILELLDGNHELRLKLFAEVYQIRMLLVSLDSSFGRAFLEHEYWQYENTKEYFVQINSLRNDVSTQL